MFPVMSALGTFLKALFQCLQKSIDWFEQCAYKGLIYWNKLWNHILFANNFIGKTADSKTIMIDCKTIGIIKNTIYDHSVMFKRKKM